MQNDALRHHESLNGETLEKEAIQPNVITKHSIRLKNQSYKYGYKLFVLYYLLSLFGVAVVTRTNKNESLDWI